ncbi:hypothetical protein [Allokutzneria albata]|uniref:Uncharacterized protein n=1 Tax=Allokutzneria albata TaxID=211114 RepID=A0A1H0B0T0_ALLAB|nr:hypothetical protein [Allokutzneria albata]SDN39244.1 hypothetical protein SAMN04489726_6405 [Allokutzneria albata]
MVGGTVRQWWWTAPGWQRLGAAITGTALGLGALGGAGALLRPSPTAVPAALTVVQTTQPTTSSAETTTPVTTTTTETTTEAPPPPPPPSQAPPSKKPTTPPRTQAPPPKPTATTNPMFPKAGSPCAKEGDFAISDQGKGLLCLKGPGDQRLRWRQL